MGDVVDPIDDGWQAVLNALTNGISASEVGTILAACVTACVGIVLLYFGARKGIKMFMGAINRGKIKL